LLFHLIKIDTEIYRFTSENGSGFALMIFFIFQWNLFFILA